MKGILPLEMINHGNNSKLQKIYNIDYTECVLKMV